MHRQSRVVKYYGVATTIVNSFMNICNNLFSSGGRHNRSHNNLVVFLTHIERKLERFLDSFSRSHNFKHHLCAHRYNCFIYPILVKFVFFNSLIINLKLIFFIFTKGIFAKIHCRLLVASGH